jgi:hypothetical protein
MRRLLTGLATGMLAIGTSAPVTAQGPPPLTPPVLGPPVAVDEPPVELPPPLEATPLPELEVGPPVADVRPLLVIPGVNTPRPGQRYRPSAPPVVGPGPDQSTSLPPIDGPASDLAPPAELDLDGPLRRPASPAATRRPAPLERRPPGFFERLFPGLVNSGRRAEPPPTPTRPQAPSDPAADAALKRAIERQIEEKLGNRVRTFEVRVVGREVVVRATTNRFWQRRGVRSDLESLPALSGRRATVLVDQ